jgi:hypothetical protein
MDSSLTDEAVVKAEKAEAPVPKDEAKAVVPNDVEETGKKESSEETGKKEGYPADKAAVVAADDKEVQQSQPATSTWSWGEADPTSPQEPVDAPPADDKAETKASEQKPPEDSAETAIEGRSSIVDFAWMVLDPLVSVATSVPVAFAGEGEEDGAETSAPKRRRWMEVPAKPPRGVGGELLHVGEVELQEGYLGWWRPCCLQLWPARLRAIALPESEETQEGQTENENGPENSPEEGELLWEMMLDPTSFESASILYASCFEVVGAQSRASFRCTKEVEADEWVKHISLIVNWVKEQIDAKKWAFVYLNVYDLAGDWRVSAFNRMSLDMLQIGGMFHAGLEVYGREYMFGGGGDDLYGVEAAPDEDIYALSSAEESGVSSCDPRACDRHRFRQTECLGLTTLSEKEVQDTLCVLARDWPSRCYRTLERNCVHFCRDFSDQLGTTAVPDWVNYLAVAASERHVIQPAAKIENGDEPQSVATKEVMCFWKHPCVLQAQNWMAGLIELLVCESCLRELERGEPHYHCHACDFDMCVACGEETAARMSDNAFGMVNM